MMMYLKLFSTKLRPGVGDDARVCPYKDVLTRRQLHMGYF